MVARVRNRYLSGIPGRIATQSKILKKNIALALNKLMWEKSKKKGGTLYGVKYQRGKRGRKRQKTKNQRGGFIHELLGYGSDGNGYNRFVKDTDSALKSFFTTATSTVNTIKKGKR